MEDNSKQIEELKELVRRSIALSQDTNKAVHAMRRSNRWGTILRWGWWLLIFVGSAIAYYYYVQPYVTKVEQAYTHVQATAQQAADWQTQMNDFFKNIFAPRQ
jgi:type II secretory pathway component PulM